MRNGESRKSRKKVMRGAWGVAVGGEASSQAGGTAWKPAHWSRVDISRVVVRDLIVTCEL
jgi:hypothetical protein